MLNNDFLKNEIPFILLTNQFNKQDFLVGMELGIDRFLFPPFEAIKISNILLKQLQKSRRRKDETSNQFQSLFEVSPFGIFEARNNKIIKANKLFYKLIYKTEKIKTPVLISGVFDFHNEKTNELKFLRCLNGIRRYAHFREIPSHFDAEEKLEIYLSLVETGMSAAKIIGLVIPAGTGWEKNQQLIKTKSGENSPLPDTKLHPVTLVTKENGFFTNREKQVLQLSAKGAPIKQIASQLGISVRTVEKHRSNIIHKTKAGNITEAVFYANQKNLLEIN